MRAGVLSRLGAGQGVWAIAAFFFPAVAVIKDDSVAVAMLLFLLETLLASLILAARVAGATRSTTDLRTRQRLVEVRRVLQFFVAPFGLGTAALLGAVTAIEAAKGTLPPGSLDTLRDRATWMTVWLVAGAGLDVLMAPVRTVPWLEGAVSWQASRTAVMAFALMIGWPIMLAMGSTQAYAWVFFALRLLSDIGSLTPRERERIRERTFGQPFVASS